MKNKDFLIEVKTKWIEENNQYSREVITYELNKEPNNCDCSLSEKFLKESNKYIESVDYIESNQLEINALDKVTGKIIENNTALIDMLLNFTKYKYEIEE